MKITPVSVASIRSSLFTGKPVAMATTPGGEALLFLRSNWIWRMDVSPARGPGEHTSHKLLGSATICDRIMLHGITKWVGSIAPFILDLNTLGVLEKIPEDKWVNSFRLPTDTPRLTYRERNRIARCMYQ